MKNYDKMNPLTKGGVRVALKKKNETILGVSRRFLSHQKTTNNIIQTAPSQNEDKKNDEQGTYGKLKNLEKSLSIQNKPCDESSGKIEFLKCSVLPSNKSKEKSEEEREMQEDPIDGSLEEKKEILPKDNESKDNLDREKANETEFLQKECFEENKDLPNKKEMSSQGDERFIHQLEKEIRFLKSQIEIKDQQLATKDDLLVNFQVLLKSEQEKVLLLEDFQKEKETLEKAPVRKEKIAKQGKKSWFSKWF